MSTDSISLFSDRNKSDGAQDALRLQEERLRLVIGEVPALVSYVDSEQCYQFTNKRYEEWFGHAREEVQGKHLQEILGKKGKPFGQEIMEKATEGETKEVSYWWSRPDSDEQVEKTTYYTKVGDQICGVGYYHDEHV